MFNYLRNRLLVAGVAAELKAQCNDQELVKKVCFSPIGMQIILELGNNRFREKGKMRYFMITAFLLAETLTIMDTIPVDVKRACFELLNDRMGRITRHMDRPGPHAIKKSDVQDLIGTMDIGLKVFHKEQREFFMDQILPNPNHFTT